jgi:hypothetical protein
MFSDALKYMTISSAMYIIHFIDLFTVSFNDEHVILPHQNHQSPYIDGIGKITGRPYLKSFQVDKN